MFKFRAAGHSTGYLLSFYISTDMKNSTYRVMAFDQAHLGLSREYLVKGFDAEYVNFYYDYMQRVAILLGATPEEAKKQMKESLLFEMKLAAASLPKEERRNASKLYNPMRLRDMDDLLPGVNFTNYVNKILTKDIIQVDEDERVIVGTPIYLRRLADILKKEPKRIVANYLLGRIAREGFFLLNKAAREISLSYRKNLTGTQADTPRWKKCVGASGTLGSVLGHLYMQIQHAGYGQVHQKGVQENSAR
ncbi:Uncharacterized protein FKW44_018103, partial [Caligus rogercresseyi]